MPTWLDRGFDIRFSSQLKARLKLFAESEGETETVIDGMSGARRRKMVHAIAESCELSNLYCALSGVVVRRRITKALIESLFQRRLHLTYFWSPMSNHSGNL